MKLKGDGIETRVAEIKKLNDHLSRHLFNLQDQPVLRRVFNCGDRKGFDYDLGGRFFAASDDNWMQMPKEDRGKISIDGEPTCEVDIKASQLSILYALQNRTLSYDPDPYTIKGIPRDVVKGLVVARIGSGKPPRQWPKSFNEKFKDKLGYHLRDRFKLKDVVRQVERRHPILKTLHPGVLDWADLQ